MELDLYLVPTLCRGWAEVAAPPWKFARFEVRLFPGLSLGDQKRPCPGEMELRWGWGISPFSIPGARLSDRS